VKWWLILLGTNFLTFSSAMSLSLYAPRAVMADLALNYFLLIAIFVLSIVGITLIGFGIRKE